MCVCGGGGGIQLINRCVVEGRRKFCFQNVLSKVFASVLRRRFYCHRYFYFFFISLLIYSMIVLTCEISFPSLVRRKTPRPLVKTSPTRRVKHYRHVTGCCHSCTRCFMRRKWMALQWYDLLCMSKWTCSWITTYTVVNTWNNKYSFINRFADDMVTWEIDRQFLWGASLLISPVLDEVKIIEERDDEISWKISKRSSTY